MPDDLSAFMPKPPPQVTAAAERAEQMVRDQANQVEGTAVELDAQGQPIVKDEPAPEIKPDPAPAPETREPDYKQMYLTLQGKYNSEIPELRGQMDGMRSLLANLNAPRPDPKPEVKPEPEPVPTVEIPEADVESFGSDLVAAARRWARAEVSADVHSLNKKIDDLSKELLVVKGTTQQVAQNTTQDQTQRYLDAQPDVGPSWRTVNVDPLFVAWLQELDPFSGHKRQDLITDAYTRGDGPRTARFFQSYLAEQTALRPSPGNGAAHTPPAPEPAEAGRPRLEDFAAPGRGGAPPGGQGAPADKQIWRQSDIAAFYRNVQRGVYQGREDEQRRLEMDIIAAPAEGRIQFT